MAKSRSKKTRKGASAGSRAASKRGVKKASASRARGKKVAKKAAKPVRKKDELDLKQLRRDLERAVTTLGRRSTRAPGASPTVDSAQERMTDFIASIDRFCSEEDELFCGSTMIIPLEE